MPFFVISDDKKSWGIDRGIRLSNFPPKSQRQGMASPPWLSHPACRFIYFLFFYKIQYKYFLKEYVLFIFFHLCYLFPFIYVIYFRSFTLFIFFYLCYLFSFIHIIYFLLFMLSILFYLFRLFFIRFKKIFFKVFLISYYRVSYYRGKNTSIFIQSLYKIPTLTISTVMDYTIDSTELY